ncbi:MAG: thioredoxin [Oscillospiraceae bacterium]
MDLLHVSNNSFEKEVLESTIPVLVDFYADWCGPCKMITPIVEELAEEYSDSLKVVKLNVDDADKIATNYSVRSIPTLILFVDGQPKKQVVGFKSKDALILEFEL